MASIISRCRMARLTPGREYACRPNRRCHTLLIPKKAMEMENGRGFEPQEPASPKVSCIGQVKKKKEALEEKKRRRRSQDRLRLPSPRKPPLSPHGAKFSKLKSFFYGRKVSETAFCESPVDDVKIFSSLGQMDRLSSGRQGDALGNVWSDYQKLAGKCGHETNDPSISLPLVIERPKTEINLWKRRSVAPPMALNFSSFHGSRTRISLTT